MFVYNFIYTLDAFVRWREAMKPDSDEDSEEEPCDREKDEWSQWAVTSITYKTYFFNKFLIKLQRIKVMSP